MNGREHDWGVWQICTRCGAEMMGPVDFASPCDGDDGPMGQDEEDDPECE